MSEFKAVTLTNWEDVNTYFEQGWEYEDSRLIPNGKKDYFYLFILVKRSEQILKVEKIN